MQLDDDDDNNGVNAAVDAKNSDSDYLHDEDDLLQVYEMSKTTKQPAKKPQRQNVTAPSKRKKVDSSSVVQQNRAAASRSEYS